MPRPSNRSPSGPSEGDEWADVDWRGLADLARRRAIERCRGTTIEPAEIAQEALVRLWLDLGRVRNRRAWLSRVVTNLVVSEIRRQRVRRETPGPAAVANSVDPVASRLAGLDLRSAFARTSRADLACLTLYAAGYSHREMAEILGGPVHRIGPRVARALGRLRRELARKIGSDSHPGGLRSDRYRQGPSDV